MVTKTFISSALAFLIATTSTTTTTLVSAQPNPTPLAGLWDELGRSIGNENLKDKAGYAIATNAEGDILAIGSPNYSSSSGADAGRVQIYEYDEFADRWDKVGSDIVGKPGENFGFSVAFSVTGDFLAVGAPNCDVILNSVIRKQVGCVKAYERTAFFGGDASSEEFEQLGNMLVGEKSFDHFGYSVDIHDVYNEKNDEDLESVQVAIGAPDAKNGQEEEVGKVYTKTLVENGNDVWNDLTSPTFLSGSTGSRFGYAVSMSIDDDLILVGAPKDQSKGIQNAGMIHLFELVIETNQDRSWKEVTSVQQRGSSEGQECGTSVKLTLRGDYMAYGCPKAGLGTGTNRLEEVGKVGVMKLTYNMNDWFAELIGVEIYGEAAGDLSGYAVDIGMDEGRNGNEQLYLGVGAPNNYPNMNMQKAGHVRVFHYNNEDKKWQRTELDIDGDQAFDEFGTSIAVSYDGHRVAAGAPGNRGYVRSYNLMYTEAPTIAPSPSPTRKSGRGGGGGGGKPSGPRPTLGGGSNNNGGNKSMNPVFLTILIIVLIPGILFLAFRGVVYWRARRAYASRFGDDGAVRAPGHDLELTNTAANYSDAPPAPTPNPEQRDII